MECSMLQLLINYGKNCADLGVFSFEHLKSVKQGVHSRNTSIVEIESHCSKISKKYGDIMLELAIAEPLT